MMLERLLGAGFSPCLRPSGGAVIAGACLLSTGGSKLATDVNGTVVIIAEICADASCNGFALCACYVCMLLLR